MMKKTFFITNFILMIFLCGCSFSVEKNDNSNLELSITYFGESEGESDSAEMDSSTEIEVPEEKTEESSSSEDATDEKDDSKGGILSDISDINLRDTDGNGKKYLFTYNGKDYSAVYTKDNWRIYDSCEINNTEDITIICEALISVHQIHGSDMESYRTAEDMAYEWLQHNLAYMFLSDDNPWKVHAQNVDIDPKDQGKSFDEIYEDRTGKEFNLGDFFKTP